MTEYCSIFPIPKPFRADIIRIQTEVAEITNLRFSPYELTPHITLHRPVIDIEEGDLRELLERSVLQMKPVQITLCGLIPFGKQYIVLPALATRDSAVVWGWIDSFLSRLPKYEFGEFEKVNPLHTTIAKKTSEVFDCAWPLIQKKVEVKPMTFYLRTVALYRKRPGSTWGLCHEYHIPG